MDRDVVAVELALDVADVVAVVVTDEEAEEVTLDVRVVVGVVEGEVTSHP
jgi:hypothetical protein